MYHDHDPYFTGANSEKLLRIRTLSEWVREDMDNGHHDARTAVVKWRNDVWSRLRNNKPCSIKIPMCFVPLLRLSSQKVWVEQDGTVWVHSAPEHCDVNGRRVLVAARH